MRVLTKSRGPRTEPWGKPQRQVCREEMLLLHLTRKQRDNSLEQCHECQTKRTDE